MIGYARLSTDDQDLTLQLDALKRAGCLNIYQEHKSATRGPRPQLELALRDLRAGDVLVVWKLDRLGRKARQLYAILDRIHDAGASFKSLTEGIDFTTPTGELMFGLLGHFAQFEAAMTAKRTEAGIAALKARGFMYGAKPKLTDAKARKLVAERKAGKTIVALAAKYGVSTATVQNYLNRAKSKRKGK
jgi:DNA invertase Pin-like site-specific DNA recombinase